MAAEFPCSFGHYVLLRVLGAGSGGAAYLARPNPKSPGWPPHVVVKILRDETAQHPDDISRFRHEAEVAVCVNHENVVRVLDAGKVGDQLYLAMDYVDGTMLSDVRKALTEANEQLPISMAVTIIEQALRGVRALHDAKTADGKPIEFVHRDLSPRNVMIDSRGHLRLIDLGLAKSRLQEWKTTPGTTLGSAGYMPPEQAAGDPVGQDADLYAIGAIAYELFTGRRMIAPGPATKMLHETLTYRHQPIPPQRPEVSAALDAFVRRATENKVAERFQDATDMLHALMDCGVRPARPEAIADFLRGRVGPVAPVPIGDEGMETGYTEAPAEHTQILARRPELMLLDEAAAAELMFMPTRAEASPFSDPSMASSSPVSIVQAPSPRIGWWLVLVGVAAAAFVAVLALVPSPTEQVAPTVEAPASDPVTVTPKAAPRVASRTPPPRATVTPPKPSPSDRAPRSAPPPTPPKASVPTPPPAKSAPTAQPVDAIRKRLERRADALRSRLDPGVPAEEVRRSEAQQILLDLTRVELLGAAEEDLARAQLAEIARRLSKIE